MLNGMRMLFQVYPAAWKEAKAYAQPRFGRMRMLFQVPPAARKEEKAYEILKFSRMRMSPTKLPGNQGSRRKATRKL